MSNKVKHLVVALVAGAVLTGVAEKAAANRRADPSVPLNHCYHWINEASNKYLTYKYQYAAAHAGEITFYTTPGTSNGAAAGPGLYCGKTLLDSLQYGDRVIRVDFVDDVVVSENGYRNHCGLDGKLYATQAECDAQQPDVVLYSGGAVGQMAWYVIKNPASVLSWTANDDRLLKDLEEIKADGGSAERSKLDATISLIRQEVASMGKKSFANSVARFSGMEKLKKSPSPNNLAALDKEVREAIDRKALLTVGGGIGKVGFLFAGESEREIDAQCRSYVGAFKDHVMGARNASLRVYLNRESPKVFSLNNMKTPNDFCAPVVSTAANFMVAIRAKQKLIADMRSNYGRGIQANISVDVMGDQEKLNFSGDDESAFMEKCTLAHDATKISLTKELTVTVDGQARKVRNVILDDPNRFCKRVLLEVRHKRLDPSETDKYIIGQRAPGLMFAIPQAKDKKTLAANCSDTLSLFNAEEKQGLVVNGYRAIEHRGDDGAFCESVATSAELANGLASGKFLVHGRFNGHLEFDFLVSNQYELECKCRELLRSKHTGSEDKLYEPIKKYETEVTGKNKQWKNTKEPWPMDRAYTVCSMVRDQTFDRYDFPVEESVGNRICPRE